VREDARQLSRECDGRAFNRIGGLAAVALGCIAVAQNRRIETPEGFENRIQVRGDSDGSPPFKHLAEKHGVDWQKAIRKAKTQSGGR
jgi:aspartyl aminopeptidase